MYIIYAYIYIYLIGVSYYFSILIEGESLIIIHWRLYIVEKSTCHRGYKTHNVGMKDLIKPNKTV